MTKKSGIYKITNTENDKVYVGSAYKINRRKSNHFAALRNDRHGNKHLQSAYNIYGEDKFTFEVIETCNKKELLSREDYWIDYYNCLDREYGYNMKEAEAKTGYRHTEEAKRKIGEASKGRTCTEERRRNISESLMGNKHPLYGKPAPNRKPVIRVVIKTGKTYNYDCIKNAVNLSGASGVAECCRDEQLTSKGSIWVFDTDNAKYDATKINNKLKQARNIITTREKKKREKQQRLKDRKAGIYSFNKPVKQINKDTLAVINEFISAAEASRETGFVRSCICSCCRGEKETYKGYAWEYVTQ